MLENRMLIDEEWDLRDHEESEEDLDYEYESDRDEQLLEELGVD